MVIITGKGMLTSEKAILTFITMISGERAESFRIAVPDAVLEDLHERLGRTRWPDEIETAAWDYGTNLAYLRDLVEYWRTSFDWRAQEKRLNAFHHFRARLDGLAIHFIRERGRGPRPMPLIVTHGWPSTFFQMAKLIPLLADPGAHGSDPEDAFDVIVPSLPGCGFSDRPTKRGMSKTRIASLWSKLMTEALGYERFGAHGGDIGSGVTAWLAFDHPDRVVGIHVADVIRPFLGPGSPPLTPAEQAFIDEERRWIQAEGGYDHIQATKPQTLAYGLTDSPAGLAAWIVEKFRSWSDCGGDVERRFTRDELLTNVMIYWVTGAIGSSFWPYYATRHGSSVLGAGDRVEVPTGFASFPKEIVTPLRSAAERLFNIRRWTDMAAGGHFASLEEPEALTADIQAFFRDLR
jgi:pimeloyl-ACP methyl ester carboxylesterase